MSTWKRYHDDAMEIADQANHLTKLKKHLVAREKYARAAELELRALLLLDPKRTPRTFHIIRQSFEALREKAKKKA